MDADWDLQAVVRGCCSAVSASPATANTTVSAQTVPPDGYSQQKSTFIEEKFIGFSPDLFQPRSDESIEQFMNEVYNYNPLLFQNLQKPPPSSQNCQIRPFSVLGGVQDPAYHHQQEEKQLQIKQRSFGISRCTTALAQGTTKIKKRKNQMKRVCQVPVEGSPPDSWSWRKYGQKPIKGSPYPRGYYKCSTSKGCSARKQVERNRSDPGMLILTYTGEHSHPMPTQVNSIAGSTRNKTTTSGDDDNGNKPTPSPPISPVATVPPVTEMIEGIESNDTDDDNLFDLSGVVIDDDTFDVLDEHISSDIGDIFSDDQTAANPAPPFQWWPNKMATTATASGS